MRDAGDLAGVMVGAPSGPGPTVLLATLNGAGSLQAQLDSYLVQTVPIGRLMVSDDGSSDGTLEILARFAAAHPAIAVQVMTGPGRGGGAELPASVARLARGCGAGAVFGSG